MSLVEQGLLTLPEHLSSIPVLSGVRVTRSLVLYVCFVDRCFGTFSFGHCVVWSSIFVFWLLLWYLQTLLLQSLSKGHPWMTNNYSIKGRIGWNFSLCRRVANCVPIQANTRLQSYCILYLPLPRLSFLSPMAVAIKTWIYSLPNHSDKIKSEKSG